MLVGVSIRNQWHQTARSLPAEARVEEVVQRVRNLRGNDDRGPEPNLCWKCAGFEPVSTLPLNHEKFAGSLQQCQDSFYCQEILGHQKQINSEQRPLAYGGDWPSRGGGADANSGKRSSRNALKRSSQFGFQNNVLRPVWFAVLVID